MCAGVSVLGVQVQGLMVWWELMWWCRECVSDVVEGAAAGGEKERVKNATFRDLAPMELKSLEITQTSPNVVKQVRNHVESIIDPQLSSNKPKPMYRIQKCKIWLQWDQNHPKSPQTWPNVVKQAQNHVKSLIHAQLSS